MEIDELTMLIMNKYNMEDYAIAKKIAADCMALNFSKRDILFGKYDDLIYNILIPKYKNTKTADIINDNTANKE